jgi:EmrB/QacA subfamily drug resistance transporter
MTAERKPQDSAQAAYPNERWILTSTILASSMAFIDGSALNVALPALQASFQASATDLLWINDAYLLMLAALILVGGSLGDRLGRKKVFMAGISLFGVASLASGLSPTVGWIIAARVVQGIGGALMIPGSLAIITATVAPNRRGRAIGTWSAASTLVTVVGPILGGTFSDLGFWRGVFLINLPLAVIALIILYYRVPETRDESVTGPIDVLGALLITLGLGGLTYGFITAADPANNFASPQVAGALVVGVLCLVGFVFREARTAHPMLPLTLFKSRTFTATNLLTLFLYGGLSVGFFFLSLNLVQVQGYSKTQAGLSTLPFAILLTVMSRWAGGLVDQRGPRLPLILGPALAGCGFLWMSFAGLTSGPASYWTSYFPGIALFGMGMGFTVAPLSASVMGSVETHYSGVASGINNAVSRTAGVLAIAVVGSIALITFSSTLNNRTASLALPQPVHQDLMAEAGKLGGASVPQGVNDSSAAAVSDAIKMSFVDTFRLVMLISAGLAWVAALTTTFLIAPGLSPVRPGENPD